MTLEDLERFDGFELRKEKKIQVTGEPEVVYDCWLKTDSPGVALGNAIDRPSARDAFDDAKKSLVAALQNTIASAEKDLEYASAAKKKGEKLLEFLRK